MPRRKPQTADGYTPKDVALVRSACLSLATYLGSFLEDLVIVGGLAPTLLVPSERLVGAEPHVGTQDLDVGISLALLDQGRYTALVEQLQSADFTQDVTDQGKPANYRWKHRVEPVTVDFLIAPVGAAPTTGNTNVRMIDDNLSAFLNKGLPLAFKDRTKVPLAGKTLRGEEATRDVWVCGAGAFVILKALALVGRGENKDAYDLVYVLQNFGAGYEDVANALRPHLADPVTKEGLAILRSEFATAASIGPMRAASFLGRQADDAYKADVVGAVSELLLLVS